MLPRFVLIGLMGGALVAQEIRALDPRLHPAPESMLSNYLQAIAQKQLAERRAKVEAITTKEEYEKRKEYFRTQLKRMIGKFDEPRTPLNVKVTGTLDRSDYKVDKIIYETRPRYYLTANLYVPKRGAGPFPAILHPLGHSVQGKNRAFYQRLSLGLVKQGFVVLTYDPIGQGERRVFYDKDLGESKAGTTTGEHSMLGWQSLLGGESVARHRLWDGFRGIDLLQSLKEVDGSRIGVMGCSGGGTMSTYIAALDDRIKAAAPACYLSSWDEQLKGTGPQDAEQQFQDQLLEGLNHSDWIGLAAPKPYLIVNTDQDFFPIEGGRKTFQEMKRIYGLYDAAVKVDWFHEPGGHGTPKASREAIYTWMNRWLRGDGTPVKEPPLTYEKEEDLNATPTGQVVTSLGGETASTINMKRLDRFPNRPDKPTSALIREEVIKRARYTASTVPLNVQRGSSMEKDGYRLQTLTYTSDAGLTVPAVLATPALAVAGKVAIFANSRGKSAGFGELGDIPELVQLGYTVLAIDPSGIGEVAFRRNPGAPWGYPQVSWLALMVGRTVTGIRMNDICRGIDALKELNIAMPQGVVGFAQGRVGTAMLHAAVVDSRIAKVIIEGNLSSYHAIATNPIHKDMEDSIVPRVLGHYDLPDLAAAIAPRPVVLRNLIASNGRNLLRAEIEKEYTYPVKIGNTTVGLRAEEERLAHAYPVLR